MRSGREGTLDSAIRCLRLPWVGGAGRAMGGAPPRLLLLLNGLLMPKRRGGVGTLESACCWALFP